MTTISTDNVRRLDALNLIDAISNEDQETAVDILAMYAEADLDGPGASHELARCLAFAAAMLLRNTPNADKWLAGARQLALSNEAQE
jgi:hypothetical protein